MIPSHEVKVRRVTGENGQFVSPSRRGFLFGVGVAVAGCAETSVTQVRGHNALMIADESESVRAALDASINAEVIAGANEFATIANRADVIVARLQAGLDFFGYPPNFVTRLSVYRYRETLAEMRPFLDNLEDELSEAMSSNEKLKEERLELKQSQEDSDRLQSLYRNDLRERENQRKAFLDRIALLRDELEDARHDVVSAEQKFHVAIVRATGNNGCSPITILNVCSTILAIGRGVDGALKVIQAGSKALEGGFGLVNLGVITDAFDPIDDKIGDIAKKFHKLKGLLDNKHQEGAMLVADLAQIESLEERFLTAIDSVDAPKPDREAFKDAVRHFVSVARAKNLAIYEHDCLCVEIARLSSQIEERRVEQARLGNQVSVNLAKDTSRYQEILQGLYDDWLDRTRNLIWQERRALEYWALRSMAHLRLHGSTVGALYATHSAIIDANVRVESDFSSEASQFKEPLGFRIALGSYQRRMLVEKKVVQIPIRLSDLPAHLDRVHSIFVSAVKVRLEGIPAFYGFIRSGGRYQFRPKVGGPIEFLLAPQQWELQLATDFEEFGVKEGQYEGISPFTEWTIGVGKLDQSELLANVTYVDIIFEGRFRSGWSPAT